MAQIFATFPGIASIERASFTLTHGVRPSAGQIEFAPQAAPPALIGDLTLSDGITSFVVPQALLDRASFVSDGQGRAVAAQVLDRRWKWRFGEVYGEYNLRDADGEIITDSERNPAQLADILLTQMGEAGVPLGALPTEPKPHVVWDGHNPADELRRLCDLWGCRVGLDVTGACQIWREGVGAAAPAGPVETRGSNLDPPEAPDSIRVLFAPSIVGMRLDLEAVGRDLDGRILPIDQLSYTPPDGWDDEPQLFPNVQDEEALFYAQQTVFRWYRVGILATLPHVGTVSQLESILPLYQTQAEVWYDAETDSMRPKPVKCYGLYWLENLGAPKNSSVNENYEVPIPFEVLGDLGVISFAKQIRFAVAGPNGWRFPPADLQADVSFPIRNAQRQWHRWAYLAPTGAAHGTGAEPVHAEGDGRLILYQQRAAPHDIQFQWTYAAGGNPAWLDNRATFFVSGAAAKYVATGSQELTYSGVQPVPIDGLNVQMSVSVGPAGAVTSLSRVRESHPFAVPYRRQEPIRPPSPTPVPAEAFPKYE